MEINNHTIDLIDDWKLLYGFIYSLSLVELETFKTYIKNNLANDFIRPSKFPAGAPILFDKKPDGSLKLCVDYQAFNNLIIKNRDPLPFVEESWDRLSRAQCFTQLDLINANYWMYQYTTYVSGLHQQDPSGKAQRFCYCIPW